ncbi:hypothetical protein G6011_08134 [Alternaria panax]|uniref:Uncharacterized protein n=1 Tax=Alternaria panax TaxID=48097 RepID=A0AAD4I9J8_9PLEO|nr:hypothetical protein G6011_08134 [Alternaria panax]
MQEVAHNHDFMSALARGPYPWLGNQFSYNTSFFTFCNYIENALNAASTNLPSEDDVGVDKALEGYAKWWKEVKLPNYGAKDRYPESNTTNSTGCFNTYNASSPIFTDTTPSNVMNRQWLWMTCNEPFGNWKAGAPPGNPSLVSRLITTDYWQIQPVERNQRFGEREAQSPLQGTEQVPVEIVPGGGHVSDLSTKNGKLNAGVKEVQDRVLKQLIDWVKEWSENQQR